MSLDGAIRGFESARLYSEAYIAPCDRISCQMTRFLYADEVWEEITKAVLESSRTRAAVAYVTRIEALPLKSGDVLVADPSDLAIASGQTSANAIETLVDRGVPVYSHPGLPLRS